MADQRDAWSEDISDRVLSLETQLRRWKWTTVALAAIVVLMLIPDDDLPIFVRVALTGGIVGVAAIGGLFLWLERRFPPGESTKRRKRR